MDFADVERIKNMKCVVFDDGIFQGYVTVHVIDGEEISSGGKIRETGLARLSGWGEMDGDDCVEFEIYGRGGTYTTTYEEWRRCVETGDFMGIDLREMRRAEYAEKSTR